MTGPFPFPFPPPPPPPLPLTLPVGGFDALCLTLDVMWDVLEVWQAILVKKLDLDSSWVKQSMSEGARQLLKVQGASPTTSVLLSHLGFLDSFTAHTARAMQPSSCKSCVQ